METMSIGSNMVKDKRNSHLETHIKVNIKITDLMDLELIDGKMNLSMKEALKMVIDMEKVNGLKNKPNILEIMFKVLNKVTENFISQVEIFIKEILSMIKDKVMDRCFGLIALFIKVNGEMEFKMVKARFI